MRMIDADYMRKMVDMHGTNKYGMLDENIRVFIDQQPTIDAVEVVRCKDCKHCKVLNKWFLYCTLHDIKNTPLIMDNFFCADGERRTE